MTSNILGLIIGTFVLVSVNFWIFGNWFGKSGPVNVGSIEVSYITMARFINEVEGNWVPNWYLGYPKYLNYVPFMPMGIATWVKLGLGDYWQGYRFITGLAYILAPVGIFLLVWQLAKNWVGGVVAGMWYSIGPTVFHWIEQGVRSDRFSSDFLDPRRFVVLVRWGEGPHTVSLLWLALGGFFLARFLDLRKKRWFVGAVIMAALAGFTNALGLFAVLLLYGIMLFCRFAVEEKPLWVVKAGLTGGLFTGGLLAGWYNLEFAKTFFGEGGGVITSLLGLFPWGVVVLVAIVTGIYFIVRAVRNYQITAVLGFCGLFVGVVWYYYLTKVDLLPQSLRYMVEADMGVAMLLGLACGSIFNRKNIVFRYVLNGFGVLLVCILIYYASFFVRTANEVAGMSLNTMSLGEYGIHKRLENLLGAKSGDGRVWVTGNHGFYLNFFGNVQQLRGALYQASKNDWPDHLHYLFVNGIDEQLTRTWMNIVGIRYVVIPTAASREIYKERIVNKDKYSDLPLVEEFEGNQIFEVPSPVSGLARVVSGEMMDRFEGLEGVDDKENLSKYASILFESSGNRVGLTQTRPDQYALKGNLSEGEDVVVAITYDKGWRAVDAGTGKRLTVSRDPLGFIKIRPKGNGVNIDLRYSFPIDVYFGYGICGLTAILMCAMLFLGRNLFDKE